MLYAGGRCELSCALCDCQSSASSEAQVQRALTGGGRLLLRGTVVGNAAGLELVRRARSAGAGEIVVRTNAIACRDPNVAATLSQAGVDAVLVPLFSRLPAVHDRIAGRPSALAHALAGMKSLARAGLAVEIEIPLLDPKLQQLDALVSQTHSAIPALRAVRFYLPSVRVPASLAPPSWDIGAPSLARALALCRSVGLTATLGAMEGVPLCALREHPELLDAFRFNPRAHSSTIGGNRLGEKCAGCAVRGQCAGIVPAYLDAHGESGLEPYTQRPVALRSQRTTPLRQWNERQRDAASQKQILVLRPTVHCNQDCTFCSANESTPNVWADRDAMVRQIARAARTGVRRVSFSGGEPTLSKDLATYVSVAARCGIKDIELVTNGVLLDAPRKVEALAKAGLTHAFVSLHAHDDSISRVLTRKVDDHRRTMAAIHNLLNAGVQTALNHVISARNYPYLEKYVEMVHREFGGRTLISFAFVTPQFKALEDIEQVPRLSEVMPSLKRALRRAVELHQPFIVGSRQGVPPCFLGEFRGWSDVFSTSKSALSEDAPQKQRSPACDRCRYTNVCVGIWKPYAARYGTSELMPVPGTAFDDADAQELRHHRAPLPWCVPLSFDDVHEVLRDHEAEARPPPQPAPLPAPSRSLTVLGSTRSRPIRLLLVGSGPRARRLARATNEVAGLSIDAVASPHAPDLNPHDFENRPTYRDAADAIDDIRPEGIILAAATPAHFPVARLALERGIPVLVEKPLTSSESEARELLAFASSASLLVAAHNDVHAVGLDEVFRFGAAAGVLSHVRRRTPPSPDSPRTWNRSALYEVLYHALALAGRAAGGGPGEVTRVQLRGESRPEHIRAELVYGAVHADVVLDFAAGSEEDTLRRTASGDRSVTWRRAGRSISIEDSEGSRALEPNGSDDVRMLGNFRDVILGAAKPGANAQDALDVMISGWRVLDALASAGAPFERSQAPRHVASRELREDAARSL